MTAAYLDTSALAKLVVAEAQTDALRSWLAGRVGMETLATSASTAIELPRAARRHSAAALSVFVADDERLAHAAEPAGAVVLSPA